MYSLHACVYVHESANMCVRACMHVHVEQVSSRQCSSIPAENTISEKKTFKLVHG